MVETEVVVYLGHSPFQYGLEPAPFVAAGTLFLAFQPVVFSLEISQPFQFLDCVAFADSV